jgi:hypothetical protein
MNNLSWRLSLAAMCAVLTMFGRATPVFAAEEDRGGPADRLERLERRVNEMAQRQEQLMRQFAERQERMGGMAGPGRGRFRPPMAGPGGPEMGEQMPPGGASLEWATLCRASRPVGLGTAAKIWAGWWR